MNWVAVTREVTLATRNVLGVSGIVLKCHSCVLHWMVVQNKGMCMKLTYLVCGPTWWHDNNYTLIYFYSLCMLELVAEM